MDNHEYCCPEMAVAFELRQIYPSMDEDGGWNVRGGDAFTDVLICISFCPYCGERLPTDKTWGKE